jgi:hypothetical protein
MLEEFFYHSFPRVNKKADENLDDNNLRGFKVLESIVRNGLLITPEVLNLPFKLEEWQNPVVQHRCCFTLIERTKLDDHCRVFGSFSIEWNTYFLKKIGVTPVFYLPLFDFESDNHMELVSPKFLYRMLNYHEYARCCSEDIESRIKQAELVGDSISIDKYRSDKGFYDDMKGWFEGLKNMVYPIDHKRYTEENGYYMQREWKLPGNIIYNNTWLTTEPTSAQQQELLSLNSTFFNKEIDYFGNMRKRVEISLFLKNIEGKHILDHANKIIVPKEYYVQVNELKASYGLSVAIETL